MSFHENTIWSLCTAFDINTKRYEPVYFILTIRTYGQWHCIICIFSCCLLYQNKSATHFFALSGHFLLHIKPEGVLNIFKKHVLRVPKFFFFVGVNTTYTGHACKNLTSQINSPVADIVQTGFLLCLQLQIDITLIIIVLIMGSGTQKAVCRIVINGDKQALIKLLPCKYHHQ